MILAKISKRFKSLPAIKQNYYHSLTKTVLGLVISLPLMVLEMIIMFKGHNLFDLKGSVIYNWTIFAISIFVVFGLGFNFFRDAFYEIFKWKRLGMNILISLSTFIGFAYSVYITIDLTISFANASGLNHHKSGFFETVCMIVATMNVGSLVNDRIKLKANQDVKALNNLQIKTYHAYDLETKTTETKAVYGCALNEYVLVKKGEIIPLDGILYSEICEVDESSLTGEARPIIKKQNDNLISGCINIGDPFVYKVTKTYANSTIKKIINGVNKIANSKPKIQQIADKISMWFTPIILLAAILAFLLQMFVPAIEQLPIAFSNIELHNIGYSKVDKAIFVSVAVLVISCPCAFGIAIPLAVLIGASKGAKNGIMFNNANIFEKIKSINAVAFDKTGTLTNGVLELVNIKGDQSDLDIIYALENTSLHPLAKSFIKYAKANNINLSNKISNIKEIAGVGIFGYDQNNNQYCLTSVQYAKTNKFVFDQSINQTINDDTNNNELISYVVYSVNNQVKTLLMFSDQIRADAYETIKLLKHHNIDVYMISGDNEQTVKKIANDLDINHYYYEIKPEQKAEIIEQIQKDNKSVIYVGDGINDLLALKQADLSISIDIHNKAANSISDINLLNNDILNIFKVIKLTKITRKFIWSSLMWAFGYNLLFIPLAIVGIIPAFIAVLIMATSDIAVVLNSLLFKGLRIKVANSKTAHKLRLNTIKDKRI
ncbi:haloacid dehalogenase [Ureaplasma diversum]|uniref:Haloacid dehalogenase n=1 Tax=Ureaplasma diversum TaxID=42094 RepID=A0A0C5RQ81_9BACT|nr:cation-translocating P-type ATPase [Ureaplasma diversum]AJQ45564.1 haloacid dehalogenase [Ureaplasma diversum]